jgi:hypothetical protein
MAEIESGGIPEGGLNGVPEVMLAYLPQGPDGTAMPPQPGLVTIEGSESGAFATEEQVAIGKVLAFMAAGNAGVEHLRAVARAGGDAYLDADVTARVAFDLAKPRLQAMPF